MQMKTDPLVTRAAVLGAAGKMGCGISWLLLQQMACGLARQAKEVHAPDYKLALIDANENGFVLLKLYLEGQLRKYAEKNINEVRSWYTDRADLIENREIIDTFIKAAMDCVRFGVSLEEARGCHFVFEAVVEDEEVKADLFIKLDEVLGPGAYYLTNTSSIPIEILQRKSRLQGRLIGFHFYNPPAVQPLVEIIIPKEVDLQLKALAPNIARQLNKIVVFANDVAGFIGNGHFIREVYFACQKVRSLNKTIPLDAAILLVNRLTQEYLLRPMGIFQLVDYVGIDIVGRIANVMGRYLKVESFLDPLIEEMRKEGITGGQQGDGKQKEGFFRYEDGYLESVYDMQAKRYIPINDKSYQQAVGHILGTVSNLKATWKTLNRDPDKMERMRKYFQELFLSQEPAAALAREFLCESRRIAGHLVETGVAHSIQDVNTVLQNGFYHLYGVEFPFSVECLTVKVTS